MGRLRALACSLLLVVTAGSSVAAADSGGAEQPEAASVTLVTSSLEVPAAPELPESTPLGFYWQLTMAQPVLPGTYLLAGSAAAGGASAERAGHTDQELFEISTTGSNDIPDAALRAYRDAASAMASCGIRWTFLAAIGRVESNHGRFGGSQLGSDGVSRPAIVGLQLNGAGPVAAIRDTDGGALDGDKVWDRAVGQMQFIPGTWAMSARDGDGDGKANPHDLDDSALAAATYLCGAGNLSTTDGMRRAALRYNHSDYYADLVLSFQRGYETGVFEVPTPPPPPKKKAKAAEPKSAGPSTAPRPKAGTPSKPASPSQSPRPSTSPSPKPSGTPKPGPSSSPKPSTPPPPSPTQHALQGLVVTCTANTNELCLKDGAAEIELDLTGLTEGERTQLTGYAGTATRVEILTATAKGSPRVKVTSSRQVP